MRKVLWIVGASLLAAVILFVGLVPSLLSTPIGTRWVENAFAKRYGGALHIEDLSLRWFSPQHARIIRYEGPGRKTTIREITTERSLYDFLTKKAKDKVTTIDGAEVEITVAQKGKGMPAFLFAHDTIVKDSHLRFLFPSKESVEVRDISMRFFEKSKQIKLDGDTRLGTTKGKFSIEGSATFDQKEELFGGSLACTLTDVPVIAIDETIALRHPRWRGALVTALGPFLNGTFEGVIAKPHFSLSANLRSSLFAIEVEAKEDNGIFRVDETSFIRWQCTPKFINKIALATIFADATTIAAPIDFTLRPRQLMAATAENALSLDSIRGGIEIDFTPFAFVAPRLRGPISFAKGTIGLATTANNPNLTVNTALGISYARWKNSPFVASLNFENIRSIKDSLFREDLLSNLTLHTHNFPVVLIDHLVSNRELFSAYLGDVLDMDISHRMEKESETITCQLETPRLKIDPLSFKRLEFTELEKPVPFTYTFPKKELSRALTIDPIQGTLTQLAFPLSPWGNNLQSIVLVADMKPGLITYRVPRNIGSIQAERTEIQLSVNSTTNIGVNGKTALFVEEEKSLIRQLLGKRVDVTLKTVFDIYNPEKYGAPLIDLNIEGDRLLAEFNGALLDNFKQLTIHKPALLSITPSQEILNDILRPKRADYRFSLFSPLQFRIQPTYFDLKPPYAKNSDLEIDYAIDNLAMIDNSERTLFTIEENKGILLSKKGEHLITLSGKGVPKREGSSTGKYNYLINAKNIEDTKSLQKQITGSAKLDSMSTHFLDTLLGEAPLFATLMGKTTTVDIDLLSSAPYPHFSMAINSPHFDTSAAFLIEKKLILEKPAKLRLDLYEEGLSALLARFGTPKDKTFSLAKKATFKGALNSLSIPIKPGKKYLEALRLDMKETKAEGTLQANQITLNTPTERAQFYRPFLSVDKKGERDPLSLQFKSDVRGERGASGTIVATLHYTPENASTEMKYDLFSTMRNVPAALIDPFLHKAAPRFPPLSYLTGASINASLKTQIADHRGTLSAKLDTPHCTASVTGNLDRGNLELTKPLRARLIPSKPFGDFLLKKYDVAFVHADTPLTLEIAPKDTFIPLRHPNIRQISLPDITWDLGKITCRNIGNPNIVSALFKLNLGTDALITLWFAPTKASLRRGNLAIGRTEILFNTLYELALWGNVNLSSRYVTMLLGLTAQSLEKALGIDNLPPTFVLPIPLRGPLGDVRLDKAAGTAKLALLFARRKGLTPKGGKWGPVLDALGSLAEDQSQVPPARPPFPWNK